MTKPHWQGGSGGKGSAARNMEISKEEFSNNWDRIFGKKEKTNEQRKGCNDGTMGYGSGGSDQVETEDAYPHDRVPPDCNH